MMGEEPLTVAGWEDVEPRGRDGGGIVDIWRRRQPLRALEHVASNTNNKFDRSPETAGAIEPGNPGRVMCPPSRGPVAPYYQETQTGAGDGGILRKADAGGARGGGPVGALDWQQQYHHHHQQQQQQENRREVPREWREEGVVVVGGEESGTREISATGADSGETDKNALGFPPEGQRQQQDLSEDAAPYHAAGATSNGVGGLSGSNHRARRLGGDGGDTSRVRGFHDMICVGFAVSLCLNLGSLTARKEGFFAAQVLCLPEGAVETLLPDLGIWVGWRQAVANSEKATVMKLEDLSMVGAAMGVLTAVGHATDCLLNAVGLAVLLYGRRKPLKEAQCRLVKRLCLASLAMAGWLLGMTVIGFLVAVEGPIGTAAVAFYTEEYDLDCRSSVSVRVDYAYAMTTLCILCQFFIGIVALPKPSPPRSRINGRCWTSCRGCYGLGRRRRRRRRFPGIFCFLCRKGALDVGEEEDDAYEEDLGASTGCGGASGEAVAPVGSGKTSCGYCCRPDSPTSERGAAAAAAAAAESGSGTWGSLDKGRGIHVGSGGCDPV